MDSFYSPVVHRRINKTENLNSVSFLVSMFLLHTAFLVAPDMVLPDFFCEYPIAIFSYFVKVRKFGNMVHVFLYPFLNLGLFCVLHIALLNVHHLSVFLHYFSIKKSRNQRVLTFLFKHSSFLC